MEIEKYDHLIRAIYDGVLASDGWQPIMGEIRALTKTEVLALLLWDESTGVSMLGDQSGADPAEGEEYEAHYAFDDPGTPFIKRTPVGEWYFDRRDLSPQIIRAHPFYQDFLGKYGMRSIMWTKLMATDTTHAGLSFQGGQHRPAYSPEDIKAIEPLLPHLSHAMLLRWRYREVASMAQLGQQLLDRLTSPVLVLDSKARIVLTNAAGQTWLSKRRHLYSHHATLQQASPWPQLLNLARQICGGQPMTVGSIALEAEDGASPTYLVGLPLREDHPLAVGWTRQLGIVVVHDPSTQRRPCRQLLRQLFGLTPAECRLVETLAEQHSLVNSASGLHISVETGRTQLKSIFLKTGSHSQSALMQLVTDLSQIH
jgi:DNA-binding CsgD family transcriptional regulator